MYMNFPKVIQMAIFNRNTHVLKLLKNIYGQRQAGRVWNNHLSSGRLKVGFVQSKVDECVFCHGNLIVMVNVDDGILFFPNMHEIDKCILELRAVSYDIKDMEKVNDYFIREHGLILDPQKNKYFEVYADADFCGNWNRSTSMRTGYIIYVTGCPFLNEALKAELGMKSKKDEEEDDAKFCSLKVPMDHEDKESKTYVVKVKKYNSGTP
jgi:hypothetical protein